MNRKSDCKDIACTQIFITIDVQVKDMAGVAIPLDEFIVQRIDTGEDITRDFDQNELEGFRQSGTYPLYSDLFLPEVQNQQEAIEFIGYIDGEEVVRAEYLVGADCCHVGLVSGMLDIVIP